jgi:hypothetical protein
MDYQQALAGTARSYGVTAAVVFVLFGIVTGCFSGWLASAKGYDGVAWFFLGLVLGVIALMAIGFAPVKKPPTDEYLDSEQGKQAAQLEKLKNLLDSGKITRTEFDKAEAQILGR